MLTTSDRQFITQEINQALEPVNQKIDNNHHEIEDLRNDTADQFLRFRYELTAFKQEMYEFKREMYQFKDLMIERFDQVMGELKKMRQCMEICSVRRIENTDTIQNHETRIGKLEGQLYLADPSAN